MYEDVGYFTSGNSVTQYQNYIITTFMYSPYRFIRDYALINIVMRACSRHWSHIEKKLYHWLDTIWKSSTKNVSAAQLLMLALRLYYKIILRVISHHTEFYYDTIQRDNSFRSTHSQVVAGADSCECYIPLTKSNGRFSWIRLNIMLTHSLWSAWLIGKMHWTN